MISSLPPLSSRPKDPDLQLPLSAWLFILALSVVRLWIVRSQKLTALGGAIYDDRLFLSFADSLLSGNWLGAYNNMTLSKGPFYSFWIAAVSKTGVPLLLSQHLLYIAACLVFVMAVKPLIRRPSTILLVFAALLFNPMSYSQPMMTQILREGIYPALTMLVVSCAIGLLVRAGGRPMVLVLWATGLGLTLTALLLAREEGIWMAPFLLIVVSAAAFRIWKTPSVARKNLCIVALPLALVAVIIGGVAGMNKARYGIFGVNELKSPDFLAAYGALSRVKPNVWKIAVPVPQEVRSRIYEVSPAFAELKPYLEGDLGKRWLDVVENLRKLYYEDPEFAKKVRSMLDNDPSGIWERALFEEKREIMGGWFVWAFREAAAEAGHHSSAASASAYYRRLAEEVNAACEGGKLSCLAERSTLMPPLRKEYAALFLKMFVRGALSVAEFEGVNVHSDPSIGDEKSLKIFRDITREALSPSEFQVQGWAFSPDSDLDISVLKANGKPVIESARHLPSPDVYAYLLARGEEVPNARNARFDIHFPPYSGACILSLSKGGKQIKNIPLDGSVTYFDGGGLRLNIETLALAGGGLKKDGTELAILDRIGGFYQTGMPIVIALSLIGYVLAGISAFKRGGRRVVLIISTALIVAVFTRLALLSLIHVTSFPAVLPQYLSPSYPLLIALAAVVLPDLLSDVYRFVSRIMKREGIS